MKKGHKLTEFIQAHWLWAYVVAMLAIPGIVDGFMYLAIPTRPDLTAPTWLTFWGSYLGGAIGCMPALAALYDNREEARRQHEENEKSRRLSVMPVFDCRIRYISTEKAKKHYLKFFLIDYNGILQIGDFDDWLELNCYEHCHYMDLCNCGLGPALQAKLCFQDHRVDLFNLKNGYTSHYIFLFSSKYLLPSENERTIHMTVECQDIYGNHYEQDLLFKVSRSLSDADDLNFETVSIGTARLLGSSAN